MGKLEAKVRVGRRIRILRQEQGLTIKKLAEKAGMSRSYLSQLELEGVENPTIKTVRKIAEALDITASELMGETQKSEERKAEPVKERTIYFDGERLRQVRKDKGLTLTDLHNLSGLSKTFLSELENDKADNPTLRTIDMLVSSLGSADFIQGLSLEREVKLIGSSPIYLDGERLKQIREEVGFTVSEVAERADITNDYLSDLEMGRENNPDLETISLIAGVLGSSEFIQGVSLEQSYRIKGASEEFLEEMDSVLREFSPCQKEKLQQLLISALSFLRTLEG